MAAGRVGWQSRVVSWRQGAGHAAGPPEKHFEIGDHMANGDDNKKRMYVAFLVGIVLAVLVAFAIAFWGPGNSQMEKAKVALAYGMLILLFMFGFVILLGLHSAQSTSVGYWRRKEPMVPGLPACRVSSCSFLP